MSDNNNDLGAFLAGFVIGGLVGAATALILAPQSGEETRTQIADKSRELRESGESRMHHYREVADSRTHEYRERATQALSSARTRMEETGGQLQEQARIVLDAGKERVSQVRGQADVAKNDSEQAADAAAGEAA